MGLIMIMMELPANKKYSIMYDNLKTLDNLHSLIANEAQENLCLDLRHLACLQRVIGKHER